MLVLLACVTLWPGPAHAQITAAARPGATPAWDKGMIPINAFTDLVLKRNGKAVANFGRSVSGGSGQFTFDYPAWTPTSPVTLELVGKTKTVSCVIAPEVPQRFR